MPIPYLQDHPPYKNNAAKFPTILVSILLGQSWDGCKWLHSSVVLNKGVCYEFPFILTILKTWMTHNLA